MAWQPLRGTYRLLSDDPFFATLEYAVPSMHELGARVMLQGSAHNSLRVPWYLGRGANRAMFQSPLSHDEIIDRLRPFVGTSFGGGNAYQGQKVVATSNAKGFMVVVRRGWLTVRPALATCEWSPTHHGSAFVVTTLPARSSGATILQVAIALAALTVFSLVLPNLIGVVFGTIIPFILAFLAFALTGFGIDRSSGNATTQDQEILRQFIHEILNAVVIAPNVGSDGVSA